MTIIKEVLDEKGVNQTWELGICYNMVIANEHNRQQVILKILYKIADMLIKDINKF